MSVLASALTEAMTASSQDLVILDPTAGAWQRHPWAQVHSRAESVAARILDADRGGAVGLVGEPTVELVAAIQGAWLAGRRAGRRAQRGRLVDLARGRIVSRSTDTDPRQPGRPRRR